MNTFANWLAISVVSLIVLPVHAAGEHAGHGAMAPATASASTRMADGQIKKIDKAAGKVTLVHGPLANLNMPAMTMAFAVKEAGWLEQMKVGGRIRFLAEDVNGVLTVVQFKPAD